jgi:peptidoglycan/xylan/chitin deacetylase (PgdA/CDA1 family)
VVLLYHRVADLAVDPWGLAVSPSHFIEHLDVLRRHTRPMQARGLARALRADAIAPNAIAVTFDDGYRDLATTVQPLLARADVPATAFVVSGALDSDREFWWDELERAVLNATNQLPTLRIRVAGEDYAWDMAGGHGTGLQGSSQSPEATRWRIHGEIWTLLRGLDIDARSDAIDQIVGWAGISTVPRTTHATLRAAELAQLEDSLVEVGAHSATHPSLAMLARDRQRQEIDAGRNRLMAVVGHRVESFAYPFGRPADYTPDTAMLVRAAGFTSAFINAPLASEPGMDPFAIPRAYVPDVDGDGLHRLLLKLAG